jgi:hypothetical protein
MKFLKAEKDIKQAACGNILLEECTLQFTLHSISKYNAYNVRSRNVRLIPKLTINLLTMKHFRIIKAISSPGKKRIRTNASWLGLVPVTFTDRTDVIIL